jgi:transcriptional regulator with XRE-family HTH domain
MHTLSDIARLLRAERTRQRLSQSELAARAGIAFRSYQRLEAGEAGARVSTLLRACSALGLELNASSAHRPTLDELAGIYGHEGAGEAAAR